MSDKEALTEFDRVQAIAPAESYSKEAEAKAAKLFAALLPAAREKDAVQADLIMAHPMPFIRAMARHYETELREKTSSTPGTKVYNVIWAPRYHDKTVLLMSSKVAHDGDTYIEIQNGYYKGYYRIPAEVIAECRTEMKPSKAGNVNEFTVVPLDKLVKDAGAPSLDDDLSKTLDEIFG